MAGAHMEMTVIGNIPVGSGRKCETQMFEDINTFLFQEWDGQKNWNIVIPLGKLDSYFVYSIRWEQHICGIWKGHWIKLYDKIDKHSLIRQND
jgi:hypothetical protein